MDEQTWVTAAPFRAHLNHVCAVTGLPWAVVALHADLPLGVVHRLLDERPGRDVSRLALDLARRILAITPSSLFELRSRPVPARGARLALLQLASVGWTTEALASKLHLSIADLDAVAAGMRPRVSALLELHLRALRVTSQAPGVARRSPRAA